MMIVKRVFQYYVSFLFLVYITICISCNTTNTALNTQNIADGNATNTTINQSGQASIVLSDTMASISSTTTSFSITVVSNVINWKVFTSDASWCTIFPLTGGIGTTILIINTTVNINVLSRSCTIQVFHDSLALSPKFIIEQNGVPFILSTNSKVVDHQEQGITIPVTSNINNWSVLSSDTTFCNTSFSNSTRIGNINVNVLIGKNLGDADRICTLIFRNTSLSVDPIYTITQSKIPFRFIDTINTVNTVNINSVASTNTVAVQVNKESNWSISFSDTSWCSTATTLGRLGRFNIVIAFTANTSESPRTCTATFTNTTLSENPQYIFQQVGL